MIRFASRPGGLFIAFALAMAAILTSPRLRGEVDIHASARMAGEGVPQQVETRGAPPSPGASAGALAPTSPRERAEVKAPGRPGSMLAAEIASDQRRSGYAEMARETRAMQDEDTANPGMLWVLDGEALWTRGPGGEAASCAACHGDARASMKGVAARYPAFDAVRGRAVDLEERINICRAERQKATPFAFESNDLL